MSNLTLKGSSKLYGWGETEDGQGLVVWKGDWFQIYDRGTTISFDDGKLTIAGNGDISFDAGNTGGGTGGGSTNTTTLSGNSEEYGWDHTEDGNGLVVWKGDWFQIYDRGTTISFDDGKLTISASGDISFGSGNTGGGSTSYTATLDGRSADYGWDHTEDGQGLVVWQGDWFQIYDAGSKIKFDDGVLTISDSKEISFNGTGGGSNTAPTAVDDTNTTEKGEKVSGNVVSNDTDPDGDTLTVKVHEGPKNGTVELNEDGTYTYTPNAGFVGTDTFTYCVFDGKGGEDEGEVTITVKEPTDPNTASIGDRVWFDENENGIQDDGEKGLAGVTVQLKDENGNVIATQKSDADGNYNFVNLAAGNYAIGVVDPTGYAVTKTDRGSDDTLDNDISQDTNMSGTISLAAGEHNSSVDIGFCEKPVPKSTIGDRVWLDANGNGIQDDGEKGLAGVTVQLKDKDGNVIASQTTDANGNYLFNDLDAGQYSVGIVKPDDYNFTTQDVNSNGSDDDDSDIDASTGMSDTIYLGTNDHNRSIDAGLVTKPDPKDASLGDRIWFDTNKNGLQDDGEKGAAGVTVQLKDANGTVVSTQTTDANGNYLFQNLAAGTYSVGVVAPDNYQITTANVGGNGADTIDSDIDPTTGMSATVTLAESEQNLTIDAGIYLKNLAPEATDDAAKTCEDKPVTIDVLGNDKDANGDTLSVQSLGQPSNGTVKLNADGTVTYTANDGFTGTDTFTYTVTDGNGLEDTATVTVNVEEKPVATIVTSATKNRIWEGDTETFKVQLDRAVTEDTIIEIEVNNGTAKQAFEDIGQWNLYWSQKGFGSGRGDEHLENTIRRYAESYSKLAQNNIDRGVDVEKWTVLRDQYKAIAEGGDITYAEANQLMQDFTVTVDGNVQTTNTIQVVVKAGETMSQEFEIEAWQEHLSFHTGNSGNPRRYEPNETFNLSVKSVGDCDCEDNSTEIMILNKHSQLGSPIALDLNEDDEIGVTGETTSFDKNAVGAIGETVQFDIDADGALDTIEWFDGSGDGILVDTSKIGPNNEIDGSALFGDEGGKYANGYEKLAAHDANGDGQVSGDELQNLALWIDDGDAVLEDGELISALDQGISAISTDMQMVKGSDGLDLMQSTATTTDGQTILTEDVWFLGDTGASQSTATQTDTTTETCCTTEWDSMM